MGTHFSFSPSQTLPLISFSLLFLCISSVFSDNTALIYRGCADQKFPDPSSSQNLKQLYNSLLAQSSKTNFSKATIGDGGESSIFGLYQCRGDLSSVDCSNCVSLFPKLARKYCGEDSLAARIQLVGCYMRYEVVGFRQISSTDLLYKLCKGKEVKDVGFEGKRDSGFSEVGSGVVSGGGFYAASHEGVYVMGQCEGDLVGSECGDCVKTALERVKVECGNSVTGQVYLNQCYVSYTFYANGVGDVKASSPGTKQSTAKIVAIVVGATAGAGLLVVLLLVVKSALKKKPEKYSHSHSHYTYNG